MWGTVLISVIGHISSPVGLNSLLLPLKPCCSSRGIQRSHGNFSTGAEERGSASGLKSPKVILLEAEESILAAKVTAGAMEVEELSVSTITALPLSSGSKFGGKS